ncbi:helix-turn-helix domain-containing protein [Pedobacter rhodius]|uniref:Helix-turn-helix transcriptional regulator n=1 Tax=Pedobacter rhodius TaxID=3004098 RepID=A0ABT4KX69_9SPHI|nr:helix-turn-helix transcriptional regulator [Pedobacter sp. SJ11]MCZ4223530.1 helix-turn-helix transcriptional regulator [Pedobacter sp. SJ11]
METSEKNTRMHLGRKISRIRELRGLKQDFLASELGISQQAVSKLEQSEDIEDSTLEKIAKILGVTKEAVLQFSDEAVVNYFNTFNDHSFNNGAYNAFNCNFNPIEKLMDALEANKELYERLLASEKEKVEFLKSK